MPDFAPGTTPEYQPVRKALSTLATGDRLITVVQLLHVDLEVSLAAAGGRAELTLEHRLVARVDQLVCLQTV